jgi:RimJ/RimL family protein N-acetyltransferase
MFPERIETDRLLLERRSREYVDVFEYYEAFAAGSADDAVFEHVPQDPFRTVNEARDDLVTAEERWEDGEVAAYVVRPREGEDGAERSSAMGSSGQRPRDGAGEIAGRTRLRCQWERRTGQLGLILRKPFWGRGYSAERAAALIDLAFDRLDLEIVTTDHNDGNERSKRAIEKYVERFEGQYDGVLRNWIPMGEAVADCHRYTITREGWEANR